MVYLKRVLRVDGFSRTRKFESICYTFPVEASHDPVYVVLLRSEFIFERFDRWILAPWKDAVGGNGRPYYYNLSQRDLV